MRVNIVLLNVFPCWLTPQRAGQRISLIKRDSAICTIAEAHI